MGQVAIVTGASSGIGRALARELAREGYDLGLTARRADRLESLTAESPGARRAGGVDEAADAALRDETHAALATLAERLGPVDLLVANAGVGLGTDALAPNAETLEAEFRVNVFGAFLRHRGGGSGRCENAGAATSSPSPASRAIAGCPARPATVRRRRHSPGSSRGMRPDWARAGIRATIVHPGYVRSELTDRNRYHMPLLMDTDRAARLIARAIRRRKKVYEFPWRMSLLVRHLVRHLPDRLLASRIRSDKRRPRP